MVAVIVLATFVLVMARVQAASRAFTARSPLLERLNTFVPPPRNEQEGRLPIGQIVARALTALGAIMAGTGERRITHRLEMAGFRGPRALPLFLGAQTLLTLGPALVVLVPRVASGDDLSRAFELAGLAWGGGWLVIHQWLSGRMARRTQQLSASLPDTLDLFVICLEAGLGLNATIARVGDERAALHDPLGAELSQVAFELRSGRSREDALRSLADRNGVDDLKALVGLVIQSDRLGASLTKTLRVHADLLRTRRRQRAEEAARRLPIKMLFPLAVFILPALMIIAAGPAMLGASSMIGAIGGKGIHKKP